MRILYQNTFDTTIAGDPLVTVSGGGNVVNSGNALWLTCPSGSDCTWWSSDYDAPYAYVQDGIGYLEGEESDVATSGVRYVASGVVGSGQVTGGGAGVIWGECRLISTSEWLEDDEPKSGLILYENESDVWQLGYNHAQRNIALQKIVSGTGTTVETTAASGVNDPNLAPMRLRLYVNTHPNRTVLNDRNTVMAPGQIAAYYSDTDGVLWTKLGSNQSAGIDVNAIGFGVFSKRSTDTPITDSYAHFDSLRIAINEAHELLYASGGTEGDAETGVWEDDLTYWHDPSAITGDTSVSGMLDKRPGRITSQGANYQAIGAWEDDLYYAFDRLVYPSQRSEGASDGDYGSVGTWEDDLSYETDTQKNLGMMDENGNHNQNKVGWEDSLSFTFDPSATWQDGTLDGDGVELFQGYNVEDMYYYDSTDEPWRLHGPGFYGAAADGYYYYNGTPTHLYEPIATSASGVNQLSWGDHNSPMAGLWPSHTTDYYDVTYPTASGELHIDSHTPLTGWQAAGVSAAGRWTLEGDFDIEVSFKNFVKSGGTGGGFEFDIVRDDNHRVYVQRRYDIYIGSNFQNEGSWQSHSNENYNVSSSALRLTRTGSTVKAYYWRGYWDKIGADRAFGTWNCYPRIRVLGTGNFNVAATAYNFRVNSGSVVRTCGWRRESAGTHKGVGAQFPERSYIIAANNSLNIINADTDKLWMRFVGANQNAYHNSHDQGIKTVKMKDGVLWASCSGYPTSGHTVRFDFTKEDCRYIAPSDTTTFGRYKFQSGGQRVGYQSSIGGIRDRNGANGFNGNFTQWKLPGGNCFGVDFMFEGESNWNERVAIATNGGIALRNFDRNKWNAWGGADYPDATNTVDTSPCMWCYFDESNGDLYWMTRNEFRVASKATYTAGYVAYSIGSFDHDSSIALPGGRLGRWEQYRMVRYGGYFYVPTDYGIYRISGPTGSWELAIGKPNSGALSEIIPITCNFPVKIAMLPEAGLDIMTVCVENEQHGWTQVLFVRMDTLALYAKSPITTDRAGQPKALMG